MDHVVNSVSLFSMAWGFRDSCFPDVENLCLDFAIDQIVSACMDSAGELFNETMAESCYLAAIQFVEDKGTEI